MSQTNDSQFARRVVLTVIIDGHDATDWMAPTLLDFTYTCNSGGKADEVQISLHDRDGHWSSDWKPKKGMPVEAEILCADWEEPGESINLPCGSFTIDEVTFSGPPDKVQIKAVSADLTGEVRDTQKTRAWENTSLKTVSEQISTEYGLEMFYSGEPHEFERQDQRNESDLAFLNRLSNQFGMSCKAHDGKLVVFDKEMAEGQPATLSIPKKGGQYSPKSYNFKESSSATGYDQAEVAYTDPKTGTTHKATAKRKKKKNDEADVAGTGGDKSGTYQERADRAKKTMTLQQRAENPAQAAKQGRAALHDANAKEQTASVEIMGCPRVVAGQTIALEDFGDFSGTYFIKTATHKIAGSGGYTTSLELSAPNFTEVGSVHDEKSEAALAARNIVAQNEQARTAGVEIFPPGELKLAAEAIARLIVLIQNMEEAAIKAQTGTEKEKNQARIDEIILCLEDIAEAEAGRVCSPDREGWLYLRDMIRKWLSEYANEKADSNSPMMIDWNWVFSFPRVKDAYAKFTVINSKLEKTILSPAARKELGDIIFNKVTVPDPEKQREKRARLAEILPKRTKWIDGDTLAFDFINSTWNEWEALYYTLVKVRGLTWPVDGLTTALNSFSLRALASGQVKK